MTLMRKVALLAVVGLSLGVGLFSFLSMQALDRSTDAMLQERLVTTHLIADYADEVLGRALSELESSAREIGANAVEGDTESDIGRLLDTYSRMSISTLEILLLDQDGHVRWSSVDDRQMTEVDLSAYPSIARSAETGEAGISGLVPAPVTETPAVLLSCVSGSEEQGVLVVAIDLARSSIGGFIPPVELGRLRRERRPGGRGHRQD